MVSSNISTSGLGPQYPPPPFLERNFESERKEESEEKEAKNLNLSDAESKLMGFHSETALAGRVARVREFWRTTDGSTKNQIACDISMNLAAGIVGGTGAGSLAGLGIGAVVGLTIPTPGSCPACAFIGWKFGLLAGAAAGVAFSPLRAYLAFEKSTVFRDWQLKAYQENVYPIFQRFLKSDERFKDLVCPISYKIPEFPVEANGHYYEYEELKTWVESKPRNSIETCPMRIRPIDPDKLVYTHKYVQKIYALVKEVLKEQQHDASIKAGFEAQAKNLEENTKKIFAETACVVKNKLEGRGDDAFKQAMGDLFSQFALCS